jgi:membrane-associated phospholipid phosphatase
MEGATTVVLPRLRLPARQPETAMGSGRRSLWTLVPKIEREVTTADVLRYFKVRRTKILIVLGVLQLLLFVLLAWWVSMRPYWHIDALVTRQFQSHEAFWVRDTMIFVSSLGNIGHLLVGLTLLAGLILWLARRRLEALMVVVTFQISQNLYPLMKYIVNRPRPTQARQVQVLQVAHGTSFPSGHVVTYVAFWGLLFVFGVFVLRGKRWSWLWRLPLLLVSALFIVLIGPSRIYVGDHWLTDVLGGYLFEGFLLAFFLLLYFKLKELIPKLQAKMMPRIKWRWLNRALFGKNAA